MDIDIAQPTRSRGEALRLPFRRHSYRCVGYLLISLPLGIAYAAVVTTGFAFGFGLLPILIGIPILSLTLTLTWRLVAFERRLAARVLGESPRAPEPIEHDHGAWWSILRSRMVDRRTYWAAAILLAKLPIGVLDLIAVALAIAPTVLISATVLALPFNDPPAPFSILPFDGFPEIALAVALASLAWLGTLHLLVRAARLQARLTLRAYAARVPARDRPTADRAGLRPQPELPPPDRLERLGT